MLPRAEQMADYDPHLEAAAQALAKSVPAFSRRIRGKLLTADAKVPRYTTSDAKITEHINRQLGLDGGQISKLQSPAAKSPGSTKLHDYLVLASATPLEELPQEHYAVGEDCKESWKQALIECGAADFRAKAVELLIQANTAEPVPINSEVPVTSSVTPSPAAPAPTAPVPPAVALRPKPQLNLADSVVMDCRVLPTNNPDDGVMVAIEMDFLREPILDSSEDGYKLKLDNVQLLLDMHGVDRIEGYGPLSRPAATGDDALRLKTISTLTRRITWHLDNGKKSRPLQGTYQEFIFARAFGTIVPEDCVKMFARRASFKLTVDRKVWPFKEGSTEFQVLETFLKKHDLAPAPGHAGSYVLASQHLMRSDA